MLPKGAENGRVIGPTCGLGGLKGARVHPANAARGYTRAGTLAIRIAARDQRSAIIPDAGPGDLRTLQNRNRTAACRGHDPGELVITKNVAHPPVSFLSDGCLPYIGCSEHVRMIKARRTVVEPMPCRIAERKSRITGVKPGNPFAERQIVKVLWSRYSSPAQ